jgi:hypothetical protein
MNPYLEKYWGDVHHSLITYARDALQGQLPGDLRARMQERVFVEAPGEEDLVFIPDVQVSERTEKWEATTEPAGTATIVAEPLVIDFEPPGTLVRETYIDIIEARGGHRVVTTIEVFSPSNKRKGQGQAQFLAKQASMRAAGVNTVEIDLLRDGERVLTLSTDMLPENYRSAYQACVWRAARPKSVEVYRAPLRERLPTIRIPLRETDRDVTLDLQSLVDLSYERGGYDDIDYRADPEPPLSGEDAAWSDRLLNEQGLRRRSTV